jgi:hypothetical protein
LAMRDVFMVNPFWWRQFWSDRLLHGQDSMLSVRRLFHSDDIYCHFVTISYEHKWKR